MAKPFIYTPLFAATLLALASVAEAGGGAYFGGGGGGGGRGMSGGFGGGGGYGGGFSAGRGAMAASGPTMSAPSGGYASRGPGGATGGRSAYNGNGNGQHGNWNGHHNGGHHNGHWHGGYYGGGYYPYWGGWWWPAWGTSIAIASTWPYWTGTWVDPYYYSAPQTYYYGPPSGTIIYRDSPGTTATPQTQGPGYRLYCPATNAYYPEVAECSQQWLKVLPNDGTAPAPAPQQSYPQPAPQSRAPTSRPAYPNGSRGYDVTASTSAPQYVRATYVSSASVPVSASATIPVRTASSIPVAPYAGNKIPAPRMALPGAPASATVVAEQRAE